MQNEERTVVEKGGFLPIERGAFRLEERIEGVCYENSAMKGTIPRLLSPRGITIIGVDREGRMAVRKGGKSINAIKGGEKEGPR